MDSIKVDSSASTSKVAKSARGRETDSDDIRHSKTLSFILRHGAAKESLVLRSDGFVRVSELMKRPKLKGCSMDTLERIVKENAKQRFTMRLESTDGIEELWIRANQGHSLVVEKLELKRVEKISDLPIIVHGTYSKVWEIIAIEGLKKMGRNHIHCAIGLFGEDGVTSGMRSNCDIYIYLNVPKLFADEIPIYTSTNGVVLMDGIEGIIPPKYFEKVVSKTTGAVLCPVPA